MTMTPIFDSAHICTFKNAKRYDAQRVVEIFNLVVEPSHRAFEGTITGLDRRVITSKDIDVAIQHHERAERQIAAAVQCAEQQRRVNDLDARAKQLAGRWLIKNTNNGRVYLLPTTFKKPSGMYTNAYGLRDLHIPAILKHKIATECTGLTVDNFVFEPVSRWNVALIASEAEHE